MARSYIRLGLLAFSAALACLVLPSKTWGQEGRGGAHTISLVPSGDCYTPVVVVVNSEDVGDEGEHYCCAGFDVTAPTVAGTWTSCDVGAGGGAGDDVQIDGVAAVDPDFRSDGDLDAIRCTAAGVPDASCVAAEDVIYRYNIGSIVDADINASAAIVASKLLGTRTDENLCSAESTGDRLDCDQPVNAGTDLSADLEEEGVTCTDCIDLVKLDDDAASPTAGDFLTVRTGATDVDYLTPNAGSDLTADLEEEVHCSDHASSDLTCTGETLVFSINSVENDIVNYKTSITTPDDAPGLADECWMAAPVGSIGGGFFCEGSVADSFEQWFLFPDINEDDPTYRIVVDLTQVTDLEGTNLSITAGVLNATVPAEVNNLETTDPPNVQDDEFYMGSGPAAGVWIPMPTTGTNGCAGAGEALQYNTTTNSALCLTGLGAGGTVDSIQGDDDVATTGAVLSIDGDASGIDTDVVGEILTVSFDPTERAATTWGAGSGYAWIYDAGATDPTITFASDSVVWTNAATFTIPGTLSAPTNLTLSASAGNDVLIGDDSTILFVDGGFGHVSVNAAAVNRALFQVSGSWTTSLATAADAFRIDTAITTGSSGSSRQFFITGTTTLPASAALTIVSSASVAEPFITLGGGASVTDAVTFHIASAPTEGTNNYAFWQDADGGLSRFDGNIDIQGNSLVTSVTTLESTELDRLDGINAPLADLDDSPSWSGDHTLPTVSGKQDRNNTAVDDDLCTGEQGLWWYDTTDLQFEFCNAGAGAPATIGGHGDGADCAAGEIPLGVDANGAVTGCYEPAEADITDLSHTPATADISDVSVTQTELAELQTIGATVLSAANWTALAALAGTNTGDDDVPESGDFGAAADLDAAGEVADDSHNHILTNIDTFTKAQLETQTSDVTDYCEADGDVFTGDHDLSAANVELPNQAGACVATDCDVAGEAGRICVNTSGTTGRQTFICEGTGGWVEIAGTGGGGGLGANQRESMIRHTAVPDTSGNVYYELYPVEATNDVWDHQVVIFEDTATRDCFYLSFEVPTEYTNGADIVIVWTSATTTGDVVWDFDYRVSAGSDSESLDRTTQDQQVTATQTADLTAAHNRMETTIALTDGNFTANDTVQGRVCRDGVSADTKAAKVIMFDSLFQFDP